MSEVQRYRKLIGEHPNSRWAYVVHEADFDAQRLRADTAEAELVSTEKEVEGLQSALGDAEQHNAELIRLMTDIVHNYNHGYIREMHRAIVNADAALNHNPEAESLE